MILVVLPQTYHGGLCSHRRLFHISYGRQVLWKQCCAVHPVCLAAVLLQFYIFNQDTVKFVGNDNQRGFFILLANLAEY